MKRILSLIALLGLNILLSPVFGLPATAGEPLTSNPIVIVVTGSLLPWEQEVTPAVVEVVEVEDIPPTANLGEILDQIPGLDIRANLLIPGGISTVSVWGSTSTQVLVLVDGIPLNTPWDGMVDLSYFPVETIERIEVQKGGASSIYGNSAIGGVVNIITKKGFQKEHSLHSAVGSFGHKELKVASAGPIGETSYYRLDLGTQKGDGYLEHSSYQSNTLYTTLTKDLTEYSSASLIILGTDGEIGPPLAADQTNQNLRLQGNYSYDDYQGLTWKGSLWLNVEERTYSPDKSEHDLTTIGYNLIRSQADSGGASLSLATDGQFIRVQSTNVPGDPTISNLGFFGEKVIPIHGWQMVASSRLDLHSKFGLNLSPRLGVSRPALGGTFKLNLGSSFKAPTVNDLFWEGPWMSGNPDLRPERSWSAETSYSRENRTNFQWGITGFYRYVNDMIRWPEISGGVWQAQNIDHIQILGLELAATYQPAPQWQITGAFTGLNAVGSKDAIDPIAPREYSLSAVYRPSEKLATTFKVKGASARYNGVEAYVVADANLSYALTSQAKVTMAVSNLFNEEYKLNEFSLPMPGRHFQAGVTYSF